MQTLLKTPILLLLGALFLSVRAEEQTAVVNEGKVNVRGQPALVGEVITQLKKGDQVTILEYVPSVRPKAGEPASWAKIKLPANTPVWVYAEMVKNNSVSATRLNLRAGPGDNYSVIGRLSKGDKLNPIRTMGDWIEIEAPAGAYAFIDASLVKPSGATVVAVAPVPAAVSEGQPKAPAPLESRPTPPAAVKDPIRVTQDGLAPAVQPLQPAATNEMIVTRSSPIVAASPAAPAVTQPVLPSAQAAPQPVAAKSEPALSRRIVRREGIVRATISIQAPTWYELVHPQTKKTIDYLHEEKLGIKLKQFKGQKVVVTGEEVIDPRWPNTPIIELETLDMAP